MSLAAYPATVLPALGAANPPAQAPAQRLPAAPPPRGAGGVKAIWLANF